MMKAFEKTGPLESGGRIIALDFTKGALVLFMILYHWLNYFVSPVGWFYNYLRFITPSFVFISGFLVTNLYLARYSIEDRSLRFRLLERGLKLLVLFTMLNIAVGLLVSRLHPPGTIGAVRGVEAFLQDAVDVYVIGNGKVAAFQILVPISYVLIFSGVLTMAGRFFQPALMICAVVIGVVIASLDYFNLWSGHLFCLGVGILGLVIGNISLQSIEKLREFPIAIACAYVVYLATISAAEVSYLLQVVGAVLSLLCVYLLAPRGNGEGLLLRRIVTLGKYSLFAYLVQIALLQLLRASLRHSDLGPSYLLVSFIGSFALTILAVEVLNFVRFKSCLADRLYRYVFA